MEASIRVRHLQQEDGSEGIERRGPRDDPNGGGESSSSSTKQTTMTDVWLCLTCALGWTMWMVSAHIRPLVERYATEGSVVYGNVLQCTMEIDGSSANGSAGSAIPSYRAIVDYVLDDDTQVRKEFHTDTALEEGFANVELLVLPTDPTSGVLKQDWEGDYKQHVETKGRRQAGKRWTLLLGAILVAFSLAGAAMAVQRLPVELTTWGWISIGVGVALLWPVAILLYANGNVLSNLVCQSKQEQGVVIRGQEPPLAFSLNPCASIDSAGEVRALPMHPDAAVAKTPKRRRAKTVKPPAIEISRIKTSSSLIMPPHMRVKINDEYTSVTEDEPRLGCYFINLPFIGRKRTSSQKSRQSSSISSVSSASFSPQNNAAPVRHPPSLDVVANDNAMQVASSVTASACSKEIV